VTLTATADPGWTFDSWTGAVSDPHNPITTLTILGNTTVTANYTQNEYDLTVVSDHGTVVADPEQTTYHLGDIVQLTATPDTGWNFANWSDDATGTDNPLTIIITGDMTVTANYTLIPYTLTVTSDHGTVTKSPEQTTYTYGQEVQLTATADPGWTFVGWSGAATGAANPVTITITGDMTVTANYSQDLYTLTVSSDHGSYIINPSQTTYLYGDVVTITLTPDTDWYFVGWSGDASGASNPLLLTIVGDMEITAVYGQNRVFLPLIVR
jgi:uncharacterized repeat protein (TIGR02543 family)